MRPAPTRARGASSSGLPPTGCGSWCAAAGRPEPSLCRSSCRPCCPISSRWRAARGRSLPRVSRRASRGSSHVAELVVAFDVPTGREALAVAARLPALKWAKLGSMLYVREGPALVREFQARGVRVFLDLKWHDIPSVVAGAVAAARELGAAMATVHCLGGRAM